jgi:rubrerythrin
MATLTEQRQSDVKKLNGFLKNELSAVETYDQCIEKISNPNISQGLVDLRQSHQERARLLKIRVNELGGEPADSSEAWGGLAKLMEGGAKVFGEKSAISMLEEGEDKGRDEYQKDVKKLSAENQSFINNMVLPQQLRSHDQLNQLKAAC